MSITSKGKKACVILDNNQVVTKILVLQEVWELEGDMLLKFAVDVAKGTTLFVIDSSTEVTANDDYKAGDYLYFSKGTFHPTRIHYFKTNNNCDYYSEVRWLKGLDDSKLTSMYSVFGGWFTADGYNGYHGMTKVKLIDVSNVDTSRVTRMDDMLDCCNHLITLKGIENFNTSACTDMGHMFFNCHSLTSLDVSHFDTSKVTAMSSMFRECNKVPVLNVSGFNTNSVTSMFYTFFGCNVVTALDVSKWVTNKVTDFCGMFGWCQKLESLDVSNFDLGIATDISNMFLQCQSLTNLIFGSKWGTQTSTAANALTLDLSYLGLSKSYKLTDETYNSMLTMYDRASNGLTTMTIKFSTKHNLPDGFAEKMSALGYTITLV